MATNRGITIPALIVTIIVLLILSGITIGTLLGENGTISHTEEAKEQVEKNKEMEIIATAVNEAMTRDKYGDVRKEKLETALDANGVKIEINEVDGYNIFWLTFIKSQRVYKVDKSGDIEYIGNKDELNNLGIIIATPKSSSTPKLVQNVDLAVLTLEDASYVSLEYAWSYNNIDEPQDYSEVILNGDKKEWKSTVYSDITGDEEIYLWTKATVDGNEIAKCFGPYIISDIINNYNVTYDFATNGGTSSTKVSEDLESNAEIDLTPIATKDGWTFIGWNTNKDATTKLNSLNMGTSDITLYAIYSKTITVICYDYNNQCTTITGTMYNTQTSASVTLPTISSQTVDGVIYTARGWSTSSSANASIIASSAGSINVSTNTTFYMSYSYIVTISYNVNGGTSTAPSTSTGTAYMNYAGNKLGASITITSTIPANGSGKFTSWNTLWDGSGAPFTSGTAYTFTADVLLYAQYAQIKVGDYINYIPDGGTYDISNLTKYSGSTSNGSNNLTLSNMGSLKWQVLEIYDDGSMDLIGSTTNKSIAFEGAQGYDNGVYLMNDICKTLYSKTVNGKTIEARSVSLEDMEKWLTNIGIAARNSYTSVVQYGKTKTYTSASYRYYPKLYTYEKGAGINTTTVSTSGKGQSDAYYTAGSLISSEGSGTSYAQAGTKGLTVTQTYYSITINDTNYGDGATVLSGSTYWLASRYVNTTSTVANFGLYIVSRTANSAGNEFTSSTSTSSYGDKALRPVVTLESSAQIQVCTGTNSATNMHIITSY